MAEKKMNPRKLELIERSRIARAMRDAGDEKLAAVPGDLTVNNIIVALFYPPGEYMTLHGWNENGYRVNRGEKGFPIWGRKRSMTKKQPDGEQSEFSGHPLAYIYNRSQVSPTESADLAV